jgi:hypothetical protein
MKKQDIVNEIMKQENWVDIYNKYTEIGLMTEKKSVLLKIMEDNKDVLEDEDNGHFGGVK